MPTIRTSLTTLALLGAAAALTACGSMSSPAAPAFNQSSLPATVQVPAGQRIAMETVGAGDITYECRAKKDMPSAFEWVFVGNDAKLMDRSGKVVGPSASHRGPQTPIQRHWACLFWRGIRR